MMYEVLFFISKNYMILTDFNKQIIDLS